MIFFFIFAAVIAAGLPVAYLVTSLGTPRDAS